ncbi:MAG TPA: universal stress protein [Bacteroidia bacterium]|jgi:nucleotide-binding universal stress UspA family protein|nr:universal stress protein [Bacteroidia bacterium]
MNNRNVHRILIPVDFSVAGQCAVEYGAFLANVFRADVLLLHSLEGINSYPRNWFEGGADLSQKESIEKTVTAKIGELAESITKQYGVYVQNLITTGKPAAKIAEAVVERDMDLIVMGTHGLSGFEEFFMGSTAHKVVNMSPCPVITIPEGFKTSGFKTIVLPVDDTMHSRQKVSNVLPIAAKCNAVVHILGLVHSSDKSDINKFNTKLNTVEEAVKKAGLACIRKVVKGTNIAMETMKYAQEVNAEMLAIMTDHESNMTGMFMGAFARQIVNHSKVPVMSIKPVIGNYESAA